MPAPITATLIGAVTCCWSQFEGRVSGRSWPASGLEQRGRGETKAFELVELLVLVLDVDGHVGVDGLERGEEPRPPVEVVPAPDGDEVPRRVRRPDAQGVRSAKA